MAQNLETRLEWLVQCHPQVQTGEALKARSKFTDDQLQVLGLCSLLRQTAATLFLYHGGLLTGLLFVAQFLETLFAEYRNGCGNITDLVGATKVGNVGPVVTRRQDGHVFTDAGQRRDCPTSEDEEAHCEKQECACAHCVGRQAKCRRVLCSGCLARFEVVIGTGDEPCNHGRLLFVECAQPR